jgi:hypothetical protein
MLACGAIKLPDFWFVVRDGSLIIQKVSEIIPKTVGGVALEMSAPWRQFWEGLPLVVVWPFRKFPRTQVEPEDLLSQARAILPLRPASDRTVSCEGGAVYSTCKACARASMSLLRCAFGKVATLCKCPFTAGRF